MGQGAAPEAPGGAVPAAVAPAACATPPACEGAGGACYDAAQVGKIAGALTELKVCRATLAEKEDLIRERLLDVAKPAPELAWWQEPKVVVGGVAVTLAVSSLVTIWLVRK